MENLKKGKETLNKYLAIGELTQPFLSSHEVKKWVMLDYKNKKKQGKPCSVIQSLCCWIHSNLKSSNDNEFKHDNKFGRSAKEIWESGEVTGCCDFALVFATLSRQLKVPTTVLETAEYDWACNPNKNHVNGHFFCECFDESKGEWVLVDPTFKMQTENYDCEIINLDYYIGGSDKFVPFKRGIELEHKMSLREYNENIFSCFSSNNNEKY